MPCSLDKLHTGPVCKCKKKGPDLSTICPIFPLGSSLAFQSFLPENEAQKKERGPSEPNKIFINVWTFYFKLSAVK
jgi:hypothetical protein